MTVAEGETIDDIEREIDSSFGANRLKEEGYAQAAWTLLSVTEDRYLKVIHDSTNEHAMHAFADVRLNALSYPLRVCLKECPEHPRAISNKLIDSHYQFAWDWLRLADNGYYNFSTIFPLWHRGKVEILVEGNRLHAKHSASDEKTYEVYNRLVRKDAKPESTALLPSEAIADFVLAQTSFGKDWFKVNFTPRLVARLVSAISPVLEPKHTLPSDWTFHGFTLAEYRKVIFTIQAMLWGWTTARTALAQNGLQGLGYRSSVWVVAKEELFARLRRYTSVEVGAIETILELLTFGSSGIRQPDIPVQPLLDLRNGFFALSPFVWLNSNAERNLCVLLNQVPQQKERYSALKNEKEALLREEIREFLHPFGFDIKWGNVAGTDVDVALIDRNNKACLCLELKWFIEPAEIRESEERTLELKTGVAQANKIRTLFEQQDQGLVKNLLDIGADYSFLSAVASQNWIGKSDAQDTNVPIIKLWHLMHTIRTLGSLPQAMAWLSARQYLPTEGKDYEIVPIEIACGKWNSAWYGIKAL